jgi:hypothetical protein
MRKLFIAGFFIASTLPFLALANVTHTRSPSDADYALPQGGTSTLVTITYSGGYGDMYNDPRIQLLVQGTGGTFLGTCVTNVNPTGIQNHSDALTIPIGTYNTMILRRFNVAGSCSLSDISGSINLSDPFVISPYNVCVSGKTFSTGTLGCKINVMSASFMDYVSLFIVKWWPFLLGGILIIIVMLGMFLVMRMWLQR